MAKPKKGAEDLLKNVIFPLRINLKTLRTLQELASEIGMAEFISWNADDEEELKHYINAKHRIAKVIFALTPPNILYSLHFEQILRYPFLYDFFKDMPAFAELYEYYKRHHELPTPDNPLEAFINLITHFAQNLTPELLLKIALEGPYALFKCLWDTVGNAYDLETLDPVELFQKLEKNIKVDPNLIIESLLDPTTAVLANPYEWLWWNVLTCTIALKEAYELEDLTPINTVIVLRGIRPYLYYGDVKVFSETDGEIKRDLKTLSPEQTLSIPITQFSKLVKDGKEDVWVEHEGVKSNKITISKDLAYWRAWTTDEHDSFKTNSNLSARYIWLLTKTKKLIRVKKSLKSWDYIQLPNHSYSNIYIDREGLVWLKHESGFLVLDYDEGEGKEITIDEPFGSFMGIGMDDEGNEFLAFARQEQISEDMWELTIFETNKDGEVIRKTTLPNETYRYSVFIDHFSQIYGFTQRRTTILFEGENRIAQYGYATKFTPELEEIGSARVTDYHVVSPSTEPMTLPGRGITENNRCHALATKGIFPLMAMDLGGLDEPPGTESTQDPGGSYTNWCAGTPNGFIIWCSGGEDWGHYYLEYANGYKIKWYINTAHQHYAQPAVTPERILLPYDGVTAVIVDYDGNIKNRVGIDIYLDGLHWMSTSSFVMIGRKIESIPIKRFDQNGELKASLEVPEQGYIHSEVNLIKSIVC